ncbi:hypothetical protein K2P47_01205 [Patescibacteria group bacterium]|nr:hypothetical protein [Patescibacteria group bacterium]
MPTTMSVTKKFYLLLLTGFIISGLLVTIGYHFLISKHTESNQHPIGSGSTEEVHVHGDFRMYLGDERIRFTDKKYQSSPEHTHHASLHFHDGNDEVIHRHADGVTLTDFFHSLGITLTNDCVTLDTATEYCTNNNDTLLLIVNGERVTNITEYIFSEEDRILLYYGDATNPKIADYVAGITDLSCVYSGTCPERGTPPTESCGLTCEVADLTSDPVTWLQKIQGIFTWF